MLGVHSKISDYLVEKVNENSLMKNADGKCKDLILEAMAYHLMSSEHKAKKAMNVRFVIFLIKNFL